jgi:UDP-glucose 4-epimerase
LLVRILVTGGAGYIGSIVAADLLAAGHDVVVYDSLVRGHAEAVPAGAELVVGDTLEREKLLALFESRRFDAVMHFAGLIDANESMQVPERYFRANTAATLELLDCMLTSGVFRFVFSSTAAVYGEAAPVPIAEDAPRKPVSVYGDSKLRVENALPALQRARGLRYATLRYFNAAGAVDGRGEAHQPESHLIPRVLRVALGQDECLPVFGSDYPTKDGTCVRDYVHVADLSVAHLLALAALDRESQLTYNVGNGVGHSVQQVVEAARRVTGCSIPTVEHPRRAGDPAVLVASSERIRRELRWAPRFERLESIIASAWEWHRPHPNGYMSAAERAR